VIYELRTYTVKPGTLGDMVKAASTVSRAVRGDNYGKLEGYWYTEIGPLNQIVHMWAYTSLDDREARRQRLAEDPAWQAFSPKIQALLETMESKIMKPAVFSPLK